jgi:hypothetical protein
MNKNFSNIISATAAISLSVIASTVHANTYTFDTAVGTDSHGDAVDATAVFSVSSGGLVVTITDSLKNPTSAGSLISGLNFDISGLGSTGNSISSSSSSEGTITSGTLGSPTAVSPVPRWHAGYSGAAITMTALGGGQPSDLIIGPDTAGNFNNGGSYTGSGIASIENFNPSLEGSASFTFTLSGVTSASAITGVVFEFGTNPDGSEAGTLVPNVPDGGTTFGLLGLALTGLSVIRRKMN